MNKRGFVALTLGATLALALSLPAYAEDALAKVKAAGALLTPDRKTVIGSLLILEGDELAEIEAMLAGDPYAQAGLFASVDIKPWRQAVGVPLG